MKRYANILLALGLGLWLLGLGLTPAGPLPGWAALGWLLLASAWSELRSPDIPGIGVINFGEGLYLAACLRYGGPMGALLALGVGFFCDTVRGKDKYVRRFNCGWALTTYSLAGLAARGFQPERGLDGSNLVCLAGASLVYGICAGILQGLCQLYLQHISREQAWREQLKLQRLAVPSAALLALLGQNLLGLAPWTLVLVLFPIEMLAALVRAHQLHARLLETQSRLQAQSRQASLGIMAAGIAHEINNPLGAMSVSLHVLERQPLTPQATTCLEMLRQGVSRCQSITQRMLTYSRVTPMEGRGPARLAEVVEDALLFLHAKIGGARMEGLETLACLPPVACEPGALVQIVTNLVSNACDALPAQGGCVRLEGKLAGDAVELRCRDNGPGVPAALRERIFEPFFTSKEPNSGTGLGLSISSSLAVRVGGSLKLEPATEGGACFLLRLPRAES